MDTPGYILQRARQAQGLSIEDVARVTRISRSIIAAIEQGDSAALPADVYVRGFTRNIAVVLGLDPGDVLQKQSEPEPVTHEERERADETRFSMLFGHGLTEGAPLGRTHLMMALAAITMFLSAWFLVGDQTVAEERAHDLSDSVPAIQESVDAVTPFTAQGLRADARQ